MGDYPEWELGLQLFDEELREISAFDAARRHEDHPEEGVWIRRVGCSSSTGAWIISSLPRATGSFLHARHRARHRFQ